MHCCSSDSSKHLLFFYLIPEIFFFCKVQLYNVTRIDYVCRLRTAIELISLNWLKPSKITSTNDMTNWEDTGVAVCWALSPPLVSRKSKKLRNVSWHRNSRMYFIHLIIKVFFEICLYYVLLTCCNCLLLEKSRMWWTV